ncbi:MAG: HAMP domain-containing protein [Deltaproteobacteria bacterium]|nr:HAMP domain-containing protein [Deltaproteobacteria bacterium]
MLRTKNGWIVFHEGNVEKIAFFRMDAATGWLLAATAETNEVFEAAQKIGFLSLGLTVAVTALLIVFLVILVGRVIIKPVALGVGFADAIQAGDLSQRLRMNRSDEIGQLSDALDKAADTLEFKAKLSSAIADGDMTMNVKLASDKDVLGQALQKMAFNLNDSLTRVNEAVAQAVEGSAQVSDSSQALSQGASEQAAALEQITSSLTELASQTKANAENAAQANNLSLAAKGAALNGSKQMTEMTAAMKSINDSSKEIAKIIKAIDDIAFQTNLLALNAAVEAARAGKHGKGFAVVAQEVRNLAGRSAKAAQETAELIENSMKKVENGSGLLAKTAAVLTEIVDGATKAADLVGEIAAASNEQAQGINQINQGLTQIEHVTQQNTANAEQTASAAEELTSQAMHLKEIVSKFKLKNEYSTDNVLAVARRLAEPKLLMQRSDKSQPKIIRPGHQSVKPEEMISLNDDFEKY